MLGNCPVNVLPIAIWTWPSLLPTEQVHYRLLKAPFRSSDVISIHFYNVTHSREEWVKVWLRGQRFYRQQVTLSQPFLTWEGDSHHVWHSCKKQMHNQGIMPVDSRIHVGTVSLQTTPFQVKKYIFSNISSCTRGKWFKIDLPIYPYKLLYRMIAVWDVFFLCFPS